MKTDSLHRSPPLTEESENFLKKTAMAVTIGVACLAFYKIYSLYWNWTQKNHSETDVPWSSRIINFFADCKKGITTKFMPYDITRDLGLTIPKIEEEIEQLRNQIKKIERFVQQNPVFAVQCRDEWIHFQPYWVASPPISEEDQQRDMSNPINRIYILQMQRLQLQVKLNNYERFVKSYPKVQQIFQEYQNRKSLLTIAFRKE